jgi:peroxiredoxin (alkyl hydroperoxide reductase subunit C)
VYPTDKTAKIEHNLQYTKAVISKPAPSFSGTAVVNGEFKPIALADYIGKYVVFFFYPLDFTFVSSSNTL